MLSSLCYNIALAIIYNTGCVYLINMPGTLPFWAGSIFYIPLPHTILTLSLNYLMVRYKHVGQMDKPNIWCTLFDANSNSLFALLLAIKPRLCRVKHSKWSIALTDLVLRYGLFNHWQYVLFIGNIWILLTLLSDRLPHQQGELFTVVFIGLGVTFKKNDSEQTRNKPYKLFRRLCPHTISIAK